MQTKEQYANGQIVSSLAGNVKTYYFKTGIVKAKGPLLNDAMHGKWLFYHENGMLWQVGNFKLNLKHGFWIRYDHMGKIVYEATFHEGKEVSKRIFS